MTPEALFSALSVVVALIALVATSVLLGRQARQMEHERNALAILESIERLTDERIVEIFARLHGINERYPTDDDILEHYHDSQDDRDLQAVVGFVETLACLARRGVLDASLLVDAVGLAIRRRWAMIQPFVERRRRLERNEFIFENFEWLAMYSSWWKDVPRPKGDRNYDPKQFAGVEFQAQ